MLQNIAIDKLSPHPDNPRKDLGDLTELAESIKVNGILQNLTVVPLLGNITGDPTGRYTVVIGHRRMAAAKLAGLAEVPCIISDMTGVQQIRTMLSENIQRSDLTIYEQAQGFQMMLDLGDTVDQIAERAGFSHSTVRRRLKLTELDQKVLKTVSSRQVSLMDFDRLGQIDDIKVRNEVLGEMGTNNFDQRVTYALKKQNIAKNIPAVKERLKKLKANKISRSDTYYGKYTRLPHIDFQPFAEGAAHAADTETKKVYYYLDEDYGTIDLFVEAEKAKPVRRSKEELEREKRIEEAVEKIKSLREVAYELRRTFITNMQLTTKNAPLMLKGAVAACALSVVSYVYGGYDRDTLEAVTGYEKQEGYDEKRAEKVMAAVAAVPNTAIPTIIYVAYGDKATNGYTTEYGKQWPQHKDNVNLDALYSWLCSLGYEMSDDEKAMQDGTHQLFEAEVGE